MCVRQYWRRTISAPYAYAASSLDRWTPSSLALMRWWGQRVPPPLPRSIKSFAALLGVWPETSWVPLATASDYLPSLSRTAFRPKACQRASSSWGEPTTTMSSWQWRAPTRALPPGICAIHLSWRHSAALARRPRKCGESDHHADHHSRHDDCHGG